MAAYTIQISMPLQRKWVFLAQSVDFLFCSVSATIRVQFIHVKCTSQRVLIDSCASIAPVFTHPSQIKLCPLAVFSHSLLPPTLATTNLLSVSMDLPLPDVSCKQNEPINVWTVLDYSVTWVICHNEKMLVDGLYWILHLSKCAETNYFSS